jgi:BON domain
VKVRALFPLAAAAGFWLAGPAIADQPAPLPSSLANPNQTVADTIAAKLRSTNVAAGADIAIVVQNGTVTLTGTVKDAAQKERIVREVRGVAGVVVVRDNTRIAGTNGVVQAQDPGIIPAPVAPLPLAPSAPPPAGNPIVEPVPLGVPGQFSPEMGAPNLPPYAWPTYAPYNNLSRVAYPTAYPYNAFPFIGPYYPFPKVPLGWRKVTLEWEDGYWYLGRNSAPHDYWRVRFW